MSKKDAKEFFNQLDTNTTLQNAVKQQLETIAQNAGYDANEKELTDELASRWQADPHNVKIAYSEPPGF